MKSSFVLVDTLTSVLLAGKACVCASQRQHRTIKIEMVIVMFSIIPIKCLGRHDDLCNWFTFQYSKDPYALQYGASVYLVNILNRYSIKI